jgi:hypothetical protein
LESRGKSVLLLNDPAHWQRRAEEARMRADLMDDDESKRVMLDIAEGYDRLAKNAERRLSMEAQRKPPD